MHAAAAAIPLDLMIRKKSDCYCDDSTFWTLTLCWAAGALTLGPRTNISTGS